MGFRRVLVVFTLRERYPLPVLLPADQLSFRWTRFACFPPWKSKLHAAPFVIPFSLEPLLCPQDITSRRSFPSRTSRCSTPSFLTDENAFPSKMRRCRSFLYGTLPSFCALSTPFLRVCFLKLVDGRALPRLCNSLTCPNSASLVNLLSD